MTPELKAKELMENITEALLSNGSGINKQSVKACAIICCDEILELPVVWYDEKIAPQDEATTEFWEKVKKEIQKL